MTPNASLLGKHTDYPVVYSPQVLCAIPRQRGEMGDITGVSQGLDFWHVFELSWLNSEKLPQVAIGRLIFNAASPFLIESKSLKLYFNSLNFHVFNSHAHLIATVCHDLSQASGSVVEFTLFNIHQFPNTTPELAFNARSIDHLATSDAGRSANPAWLTHQNNHMVEETLYSDLLRSNCPVTQQPDWATVIIRYHGKTVSAPHLLHYLLSFRTHSGFHEQCVEQIYRDIWQTLQPERLMVYAMYTRRGGLDINPCRVSHLDWLPAPVRFARQ